MNSEEMKCLRLEPVFTAEEVADLLKISVSMVYKLRRSGALPFIRVGAGYRFTTDAVRRFMRGEGPGRPLKAVSG